MKTNSATPSKYAAKVKQEHEELITKISKNMIKNLIEIAKNIASLKAKIAYEAAIGSFNDPEYFKISQENQQNYEKNRSDLKNAMDFIEENHLFAKVLSNQKLYICTKNNPSILDILEIKGGCGNESFDNFLLFKNILVQNITNGLIIASNSNSNKLTEKDQQRIRGEAIVASNLLTQCLVASQSNILPITSITKNFSEMIKEDLDEFQKFFLEVAPKPAEKMFENGFNRRLIRSCLIQTQLQFVELINKDVGGEINSSPAKSIKVLELAGKLIGDEREGHGKGK